MHGMYLITSGQVGKRDIYFRSGAESCLVLPCLVLSCLALSCLVMSCDVLVLSYLALSCLALSCLVLSCLVMFLSCLVQSSLALPCRALPCLVLSCLVLSSLVVFLSCFAQRDCTGFPFSQKSVYLVFSRFAKVIGETGLTEIDVDSHGYGSVIHERKKGGGWFEITASCTDRLFNGGFLKES